MKILYTQKGNTVYIDDDKAEKFNGYYIYENNGQIKVNKGSETHSIIKFMFEYGNGVIARRKDKSLYDFRRSNISFKKKASMYTGVTRIIHGGKESFVVSYYLKGETVELGYYSTEYDAAVVREYTIRKNNVDVKPTGISLSDRKLEEDYIKIMSTKAKQIAEMKKEKADRLRNYFNTKEDNKYNIHVRDNKYYCRIYVNNKTIHIGTYSTYNDAAIVRNCYVIENKLGRALIPLGIPIEKQFEMRKCIKTVGELRQLNPKVSIHGKRKGNKYKGINTQKRNGKDRYVVNFRTRTESFYVGESMNIEEAAMMYNIYVTEKGLTDKIMNEFELTIEQQKEYLKSKGYTFEGFKFKRNKKNL